MITSRLMRAAFKGQFCFQTFRSDVVVPGQTTHLGTWKRLICAHDTRLTRTGGSSHCAQDGMHGTPTFRCWNQGNRGKRGDHGGNTGGTREHGRERGIATRKDTRKKPEIRGTEGEQGNRGEGTGVEMGRRREPGGIGDRQETQTNHGASNETHTQSHRDPFTNTSFDTPKSQVWRTDTLTQGQF